jgi:hypothetical protein
MSGIMMLLLAGVKKAVVDPFFNYVTLLLPGSGTNGAQNNTFVDSSTNAFTITRNGNTTQGTFSPFSQTGWSAYFDGTGDYLTTASSTSLALGASDFTVDIWFYPTTTNSYFPIDFRSGCTLYFYVTSGTTVNVAIGGNSETTFSGVVTNAWNHFACVRSGSGSNNVSYYLNGVRGAQQTDTTNFSSATTITLGKRYIAFGGSDFYFQGYLSNARLVVGTAIYSGATYTVPNAPLTAIANTELLTCQSNRFIDNSSNAFAITVNGNTSIQAFSPFNPTAVWSAATNGGSGYFDGSGDQLGIANNAAFEIGNGDFSYEAWVYALRQTNTFGQGIISYGITGNTGSSTCDLQIRNDGYLQLAYATGASGTLTDSSLFPINQWVHTVACRSGSTLSIFVNGSRAATTTTSATVGTGGAMTIGGQWYANQPERQLQGYISDARVLKGASAYDATQSTITIPTSPVTAITNTEILCNFTNAGIYDATAKNDLETVGNAQISTTQSKFGGSSMYFDGTGDYLYAPNSQQYVFGSGDFTIEFWLYLNSAPASGNFVILYDLRPASTQGAYPVIYVDNSTATIKYWVSSADRITGSNLSINTWYHVAVSRVASQTKMFVNGTQVGSTYADSNSYLSSQLVIGASAFSLGTQALNGYINDLRITKGYARYTTGFTPPTAAFPIQ